MMSLGLVAFLLHMPVAPAPQAAPGSPSKLDIDRVLARGTSYLIKTQWLDGSWTPTEASHYASGQAGLCLYTLAKAGLAKDHATMRAGLRFVKGRPFTHVYSVACCVMAWATIDPVLYRKDIEAAVQFFERAQTEGGGWHYQEHGTSPGDLSNTQYALLGLRAAEHAQVGTHLDIYERASEQVHRWQYLDGGFCYNSDPRTRPTGSMTAAGLTSLSICAEQLLKLEARKRDATAKNLKSWIDDGLDWLSQNFAANPNPEPYNKDPHQDRWPFYYLYGVERAGGLLMEPRFGEHDWYQEGASYLVRKQRPDGSFGDTGWNDDIANTCFALLFLKRATARTESLAVIEQQVTADAVLRVEGVNPVRARLTTFASDLVQRCAWPPGGPANLHVRYVEYFVDKQSVAKIDADPKAPIQANRFAREIAIGSEGGEKQVSAAVMLALPEDGSELIETNVVTLQTLAATPAHVLQFLDANAENLLKQDAFRNPIASSYLGGGFEPMNAFDGVHATRWVCKEDDQQPWLKLELKEPILANRIRVQRACLGPLELGSFAQPTEIAIELNGKFKLKHTMAAPELQADVIEIPRMRIMSIELRITAKTPGKAHPGATGFEEVAIELAPTPRKK